MSVLFFRRKEPKDLFTLHRALLTGKPSASPQEERYLAHTVRGKARTHAVIPVTRTKYTEQINKVVTGSHDLSRALPRLGGPRTFFMRSRYALDRAQTIPDAKRSFLFLFSPKEKRKSCFVVYKNSETMKENAKKPHA